MCAGAHEGGNGRAMGKDMAREEETAARRPGDDPEEGKEAAINKNKRYRRDKPWDNEDIDHWKVSAHVVGAAQSPERVVSDQLSCLRFLPPNVVFLAAVNRTHSGAAGTGFAISTPHAVRAAESARWMVRR